MSRGGRRGCWVIALGTDDAADADAVACNVNETQRIQKMMAAIGDREACGSTQSPSRALGAYSASNMAKWDKDLEVQCSRYPNMQAFAGPR